MVRNEPLYAQDTYKRTHMTDFVVDVIGFLSVVGLVGFLFAFLGIESIAVYMFYIYFTMTPIVIIMTIIAITTEDFK